MQEDVQRAAAVIKEGGIVAYATEYCFGLGCDPTSPKAVTRLLCLKRRPAGKGLILIAADVEQLLRYIAHVPAHVAVTWPGPHTWLLEPLPHVPRWITGAHPRVAVRVTAHLQAAALCHAAGGPIVSTSANRAGQRPARSYREALRRLGASVDYVLPGRVGTLGAPTSIRDAATGAVVRPG